MYNTVDIARTIAGTVLLASSACFIYLFAPYKPDLFSLLFRPVCVAALISAVVLFFACLIDAIFLNSTPKGRASLRALCSLAALFFAARNCMWLMHAGSNAFLAGQGWLESWPCWTIFLPIFTVSSLSFKKPRGQ
jgi:hypothetical protein